MRDTLLESRAGIGLFERLPEALFRPLASQNRHLYWDLLVHLHEQFFGADAPPAPDEGYLTRSVTIDVERFMSTHEWLAADGEVPEEDTPNGKARYALRMLIEAGWLIEERIGVRTFLDMKPTVQKFLELIKQFAEEGPQFIGGKVQLIYHQLMAVRANPAEQAMGFHETAKQARALISMLKATNLRVREVMEALGSQHSTSEFVRAFFTDYIANLYIRDYHELRTENHPLKHRYEILEIVAELQTDVRARDALIGWYAQAFKVTAREQAEALFEKDLARFATFTQIEDYLDRLNNSVSRTTRRAVSFIHYKLRTRDRIDQLLDQSFAAFEEAAAQAVPLEWPLACGPLFSEHALREPRLPPAPPKRTPLRKPVMSPELKALRELRRQILLNREVSVKGFVEYLESNVPAGTVCSSDTLPLSTVKDMCCHAALVRLTLASEVTPVTRHRQHAYLAELRRRGISLHLLKGEVTDNDFFTAPKIQVRR